MNRAFLLTVLLFMTILSLSFSNIRAKSLNNSCSSEHVAEQNSSHYQQQIRNSYEIIQYIKMSMPRTIVVTLMLALLLIAWYFHGNKTDMLRFIYGTDNLSAIFLTVFGGLFNILELLLLFAFSGLPDISDIPPLMKDLMLYFVTSWKTWVFVVGLIGLRTSKLRSPTQKEDVGIVRSFIMSKGYQMPIWLIIIGVMWLVDVATDVLPSLLKWGVPPGTVTELAPTPVDRLPLSEIFSFFLTEPSFILIATGVCAILLKWITSLLRKFTMD